VIPEMDAGYSAGEAELQIVEHRPWEGWSAEPPASERLALLEVFPAMPHKQRDRVVGIDRCGGAGLLGVLAAVHLRSIPRSSSSVVPASSRSPACLVPAPTRRKRVSSACHGSCGERGR
jgi:hypothetical protein